MARANGTLLANLATELTNLRTIQTQLRAAGDTELADVVKRAIREFEGGAGTYTSIINTLGVDSAAYRK